MDFCARMGANLVLKEIEKKGGEEKNLVVSPLSFNAILNMIAAGSTGSTLKQMNKFLKYRKPDDIVTKFVELLSITSSGSSSTDGGPTICLANALWVDKEFPLKASYQELVQEVFKAQVKNVDFVNEKSKVVKEANEWAKSSTKGLVTKVLKPQDITIWTKLIHGNALYFKGVWDDYFIAERTKDKDFYLLNGDKISAPFMTGCNKYYHKKYDGYELVQIPYRRGKDDNNVFSMFIFLPDERDGLIKLMHKATSVPGFFRKNFQMKSKSYDYLWIPKFKFTYDTYQAPERMIEMGLKLPFMADCMELTEMVHTKGDPFCVSMIVQKASVEIDEVGVKAAAVTYESDEDMGCSLYFEEPEIREFVADHPFLFMIREETTKSVLFTGAVLNPLLQE